MADLAQRGNSAAGWATLRLMAARASR